MASASCCQTLSTSKGMTSVMCVYKTVSNLRLGPRARNQLKHTLVLQSDWAKTSRLLSFVVHKSPDPLLVYIRSGNVSLQWTSCVETLHDV